MHYMSINGLALYEVCLLLLLIVISWELEASASRLKYIMLLKLPIILSSNSFYFNLLFPKLFPVATKHPIATKLSLIYKAMLKITVYPTYKRSPYKIQDKICGTLN